MAQIFFMTQAPTPTLDVARIRVITLDLDDTLWPVWPTIERAERALCQWLGQHAPRTRDFIEADRQHSLQARQAVLAERPELAHNLGRQRLEAIRLLLRQMGDDPALAEPAYKVFHAERQRVTLFDDALPALEFLSTRWPVVALSNGNADVRRVGLGRYFSAAIAAGEVGMAKPEPRMFELAAEAAGARPDQVLHVGDDAHMDAAGALRVGMQAAWVNRQGQPWPDHVHATRPQVEVSELAALCRLLSD